MDRRQESQGAYQLVQLVYSSQGLGVCVEPSWMLLGLVFFQVPSCFLVSWDLCVSFLFLPLVGGLFWVPIFSLLYSRYQPLANFFNKSRVLLARVMAMPKLQFLSSFSCRSKKSQRMVHPNMQGWNTDLVTQGAGTNNTFSVSKFVVSIFLRSIFYILFS